MTTKSMLLKQSAKLLKTGITLLIKLHTDEDFY